MAIKDIEPKLKYISDYLNIERNPCFVIPEYQRAYSWNITQCDKLWQDIESFIESDNKDPYFFGTVIIDCSNPEGELHLIDGQQRTTTFLLLLKAMLILLQDRLKTFARSEESEALEESLKENRNRAIDILCKTNGETEKRMPFLKDAELAKQVVLLVNRSINEQFKDELKNILGARDYNEAEHNCYKFPRRQKDNKYTNFFRNFKFFYEKLRNYPESKLNSFASGFLRKCQIIEIRSWQTEQAITMFNSLNSTGLPLSDADIISAQMYSYAKEDRELFNDKWQRIIRLSNNLSSIGIVNLDSVLQQYMYIYRAKTKEYYNGNTINVTTPGLRRFYITDHIEILKDPIAQCNKFSKIAQIWDCVKDYSQVKLLLKFNDNAKIFLAAYLYRYDVEDITPKRVSGICDTLIRLFAILELVDTGYSSASFKTFLFGEALKLVDETVTIEDIQSDFNNHIRKTWDKTAITDAIKEYDKNILVFLNDYLYTVQHGLKFEFDDTVNIEHIMPSSGRDIETIRIDAGIGTKEEFMQIVNKIGNKIILEEDINKSIGNEWFKTKKSQSIGKKLGYVESKYALAISLSHYPNDVWTKDDIEAKTNKAAERIADFIFGVE